VDAVDLKTVWYACAALCRLCSSMENADLILESGAVPTLVERVNKGDHTKKDEQSQRFYVSLVAEFVILRQCSLLFRALKYPLYNYLIGIR
jgi:hypothetical protein